MLNLLLDSKRTFTGAAAVVLMATALPSCQKNAEWQAFDAAGLKLELPGKPAEKTVPMPEEAKAMIVDNKLLGWHPWALRNAGDAHQIQG